MKQMVGFTFFLSYLVLYVESLRAYVNFCMIKKINKTIEHVSLS